MRKLRKTIEIAIPIVGMLIVLGGILFFVQTRFQIAVAVVGLLIIEAGVWGLARPVLPDERRYYALRSETERFMGLVRRLNATALEVAEHQTPDARERFEEIRSAMAASVERMGRVAGKTVDASEPNIALAAVSAAAEAPEPVSPGPDAPR